MSVAYLSTYAEQMKYARKEEYEYDLYSNI